MQLKQVSKNFRASLFGILLVLLSGCIPTEVVGTKPDGIRVQALFYPGGGELEDLLVLGGRNYFGKAQYQADDPHGDIGFRLRGGERIQAECAKGGKNIIGQPECKAYTVYRSTFALIPEKTQLWRTKASAP